MRIIISFIFLILVSSCEDSSGVIARIPEPENLIQRELFTDILTDLVKLEGHMDAKYAVVTKYHKTMIHSGDSLLKMHNVNLETFESSMEYYGSRQDLMKSIYDDVLDELNKELGDLESVKK